MTIHVATIHGLVHAGSMRWTNHILTRILQRGITTTDVTTSLLSGEIIEQYPSDYSNPSCLVLGIDVQQLRLHIVCGVSQNELWLITAYRPNPSEWESDFKTRKGRSS